jgi:DNA polymerase-3 subunit gamma/tau
VQRPTSPPAHEAVPTPAAQRPAPPTPGAQEPTAPAPAAHEPPATQQPAAPPATQQPAPEPAAAQEAAPPADAGGVDLVTVRRMWPDVLEAVKGMRRFTWTLLSHNAQVAGLEAGRLTLTMVNAGARDSFQRGGSDEIVREALIQVLGVDWKVDAIVDPSTQPPGPAPAAQGRPAPQAEPSGGRAAAMAAVADESAAQATNEASTGSDDAPSHDDDDADDTGLSSQDLLSRELGAKVIGEYDAS